MASIIPGYEYDIFISYRQKDNKYDSWVTEFVDNLRKELEATFKEEISIYFDENPQDGLLVNHSVEKSLKDKLKSLIFIPIISQTYCDPKSYAWEHELCVFNRMTNEEIIGRDIKLNNGNVASRILPVMIHDLDPEDKMLLENELKEPLRAIEFIYREPGVNRPLTPSDDDKKNLNNTRYRNQINKVANAVKGLISGLKKNTGQSVELGSQIIPSQSIVSKKSLKKNITVTLLVLVLILSGWFIIPKIFNSNEIKERSIAVLPFKLLSDDPDKQYLADGVMEAILLDLQKSGDLRVMSLTSVEQYRNTIKTTRTIGQELTVEYLLEGSFQKEGDNATLNVLLVKARAGNTIWSQEYKRTWKDIFSVQSDVAQTIARELQTMITPEAIKIIERIPTQNLSSYDLYLKANGYFKNYTSSSHISYIKARNSDTYEKAITFYRAALDIDSAFARAYTGLALAFLQEKYWKGYFKDTFLDTCVTLANKALLYDDQVEEAYYVKGIYAYEKGDVEEAIEYLDHALKINPNYYPAYSKKGEILIDALNDYVKGLENYQNALVRIRGDERSKLLLEIGYAYIDIGFFEKAKECNSEAFKLSRDSVSYYELSSQVEFDNGNFDKALYLSKKANNLDSTSLVGLYWYTLVPRDSDEAKVHSKKIIKYYENSSELNLVQSVRIGYVLWKSGKKKEADYYFKQQIKYDEESIKLKRKLWKNAQYDLAATYAYLNDTGKAYMYLDEFNQNVSYPLWWVVLIKNDPLFWRIRNDERFKKVVQNMEAKNNREHERVRVWLENQESANR